MDFSLESFLHSGHEVEYKKYDHILRQGEISRNVYFVIEGVIRHYMYDASGNEKTIRISREQDFFYSSNISFWREETSYVNCQVLTDARLLYWSKTALDQLSNRDPGFVLFENTKLKDFIIEKHRKEISRITKNAEERFKEFIESNLELFNRIPHHVIASYLDMTPETLSRLRAKMR